MSARSRKKASEKTGMPPGSLVYVWEKRGRQGPYTLITL